jgi:hypothetical protein
MIPKNYTKIFANTFAKTKIVTKTKIFAGAGAVPRCDYGSGSTLMCNM